MRRRRTPARLGTAPVALLLAPLFTVQPRLAQAEPDRAQASAAAQLVLPKPNQGMFLGLSLVSTSALGFDSERSDRGLTIGAGLGLRVGESVTDWLDLGLALAYARTSGADDDRLSYGRLALHSQWYLHRDWFARLDLGIGSVAGPDPIDPSVDRGGYRDIYTLGIGTNLLLSPYNQSGGWVLSPILGVDVAPSEGLTVATGWFGVEISYWSGLADNQLVLPIERAYDGPEL